MTKVVAISGSPDMEKSNTSMILDPFLEGVRDAGASVDLFYAKRLKVRPCIGDFDCWEATPGECRIRDDMQAIYPKLKGADILVLATPVYIPLPGEMQNVINRLCPLLNPIITMRDGRSRAKLRADVRISRIVLVSSCGWWEKGNFDTVVRIAKELAKDMNVKFAGAVLRPHVHLMSKDEEEAKEVFRAAKRAGYEVVKHGRIPKELLDTVAKPLISEKEFKRRNNARIEDVNLQAR